MYSLYLDNFRGFQDTIIDFADVNFFVGENSTGKSSLLSLMSIISGREFWQNQLFSNDFVDMGTFKDIVSTASDDKKYFNIGFVHNDRQAPGGRDMIFFHFKFVEKDYFPKVEEIFVANLGRLFHIKIVNNKIYGRSEKLQYKVQRENFSKFVQNVKNTEMKTKFIEIDDENIYFYNENYFAWFLDQCCNFLTKSKDLRTHLYISMPREENRFIWISPIRSKPKRTYDLENKKYSPEGEHTPYILRKYTTTTNKKMTTDIRKFGNISELYSDIQIKSLGASGDSPFEIQICLGSEELRISNVGYGISQILPIVVEIASRNERAWFLIQQPEVHLHPKAQAAFGEYIFATAMLESKRFFIETHSDYIIDRFRTKMKSETKKVNSKVFFTKRDKGYNNIFEININDKGEFDSEHTDLYREFYIKEVERTMGIE